MIYADWQMNWKSNMTMIFASCMRTFAIIRIGKYRVLYRDIVEIRTDEQD